MVDSLWFAVPLSVPAIAAPRLAPLGISAAPRAERLAAASSRMSWGRRQRDRREGSARPSPIQRFLPYTYVSVRTDPIPKTPVRPLPLKVTGMRNRRSSAKSEICRPFKRLVTRIAVSHFGLLRARAVGSSVAVEGTRLRKDSGGVVPVPFSSAATFHYPGVERVVATGEHCAPSTLPSHDYETGGSTQVKRRLPGNRAALASLSDENREQRVRLRSHLGSRDSILRPFWRPLTLQLALGVGTVPDGCIRIVHGAGEGVPPAGPFPDRAARVA